MSDHEYDGIPVPREAPDNLDQLAEQAVADDGPEDHRDRPEPITDMAGFDETMRRLAHYTGKVAEIRGRARTQMAPHEEAIRMVQVWAEAEEQKHQYLIAQLTALAEAWALACRRANPREKSQTSPYGRVETREQQPEWTIDDPAAAGKYLRSRPAARDLAEVRPEWSIAKAALKRRVSVVDGLAYLMVDDEGTLAAEPIPGVKVGDVPDPKATVKPERYVDPLLDDDDEAVASHG